MEYEVQRDTQIDQLVKKVNGRIKDGWEPHGGLVCALAKPATPVFMQAMVRYTPEISKNAE